MKFRITGYASRTSALCLLLAVSGSAAHAGIFRRKSKPLSQKDDALASVASSQPDKELFDRAMLALKKGKFDIARLDLQTLLNTYPDSEYAMRAKLAIGDTWYKEGGSAALQQAEQEYKDFITFFPDKPEAAEAQMKVADIYYKQMEKPDRDPTNAIRAQEEYRAMILQYPDSSLIPQARQKLREVQEVLGDHEFDIGSFYHVQQNYAAATARLQSIVDSYPLYSRIDEALLDIGDGYAAQAKNVNMLRLDPAAKERLHALYLHRAQQAYDRIILEYPMMPHADDARDRLEAMGLPVPQPTEQAVADSAAIEQSRAPINLKYKAFLLITARPSTIQAARVGNPSLANTTEVLAPSIVKETMADYTWALKPDGKPAPTVAELSNRVPAQPLLSHNAPLPGMPSGTSPAAPESGQPANSLQLNDIGGENVQGGVLDNNQSAPQTAPQPPQAVQPPAGSGAATPQGTKPAAAQPDAATSGQPDVWPSAAPDNGGLKKVAPKNSTPLPAATSAASAPAQVNDVPEAARASAMPQQETTASNGKKKKKQKAPKFASGQESSSAHKKKKGLHKLW